MADYKQGDVTINGVKIHYYRSGGRQQPIILLHGVSDSGLCWGRTARDLSAKYDVIMVDAQGHGLSGRAGKDFSYESHTKQVAGLVKELGLEKPVIMGHSMGAGTAAGVAAEYPGLPKAIILEDPPWSALAPHPQNAEESRKMHQEFRAMFTDLKKRRIQDIVIESQKMDPAWAEEERLPWAAAKKQFDISLFDYVVVDPRPFEDTVVKIQCPTLLITADKGVVSRETAEKAGKIWTAKAPYRWVRIEGAGHNIRREQYAAYIKTVEEWLQELG
jgi:pimeloyl-ACP methyl ester carboxylesterase